MKKSKRRVLLGCCLIFLLFTGMVCLCRTGRHAYRLEVVKVEEGQGYGYRICQGKKTVVYQPFIPAVPYKRAFSTAEEAEDVGRLVIKRIENGDDFSVTKEDLSFCLPSLN